MSVSSETVRQIDLAAQRLSEPSKPELSADLISPFLALPGLRGFWPMGDYNEGASAYDLSEQGRVLTDNGNPQYSYDGIVPYIDLDGNNDFLFRNNEAGLSITATETYVAPAVRGLTLGGWFWFGHVGSLTGLVTKWTATGNQRSYRLYMNNAGNILLGISVDGIVEASVASVAAPVVGSWYFLAGRFIPNTELAVFVNEEETAGGIPPASIFSSTVQFQVGSIYLTINWLLGRASLVFLCATALSDAIIYSAFQQTRGAFRV